MTNTAQDPKEQKILKLKLDIVFKKVFGDRTRPERIISLLAAILKIPRRSIKSVIIENPEIPPEELQNKAIRLDLKLKLNDRTVNVEMQICHQSYYRDRTLFYWAKLFTEPLKSGEEYDELKETICINIINFNLFDKESYYSLYRPIDSETGEVLSEKFQIIFCELQKLEKYPDGSDLYDWLCLINAETEADLMAIEERTSDKEISDTIVRVRELSADDNEKMLAFYRERALHDEASNLKWARNEGKAEGIIEGRREGIKEGRKEGIKEGRKEGRREGIDTVLNALRLKGISEEIINSLGV